MAVNIRRRADIAVPQPLLNVFEGNARWPAASWRSCDADRESASGANRDSPEISEMRWSGIPPASARPTHPRIQSHRIHSCSSCRRPACSAPAPQQAILTVRAGDLNSAKSASGYSLAVLADYFVPPYFPLYPYYNPNRAFWPVLEDFFKKMSLLSVTFRCPLHQTPCISSDIRI